MRASRSLRLLHVASGLEWRGRQMQALALARGLADRGHRPVLAGEPRAPLIQRAAAAGLPTAPVARGALPWSSPLRRVIAGGGWDVIHLHDPESARAASRAGRTDSGPPRVLSVGAEMAYRPRWRPASWRHAGWCWADSEGVWSALVAAGLPGERISVIHSGIDLPRFTMAPEERSARGAAIRQALGLGADAFVAGTVMHMSPGAGIEDLIEAAARIRTGVAPPGEERLGLLVVGDGPGRGTLARLAARPELAGAAVLTGWRDDVPDLMAAMDVYVHPVSSGGGFPLALREAMALEIPVIATDQTGIREIIDNGKHGLIVPAGDPDAIARGVLRYRRDPALGRECARLGRLKVQRYGLRSMVDRAEELYFRLIR